VSGHRIESGERIEPCADTGPTEFATDSPGPSSGCIACGRATSLSVPDANRTTTAVAANCSEPRTRTKTSRRPRVLHRYQCSTRVVLELRQLEKWQVRVKFPDALIVNCQSGVVLDVVKLKHV